MYKPSYHEVPLGFSYNQLHTTLLGSLSVTSSWDLQVWTGSVFSVSDFHGLNLLSTGALSLPSGHAVFLGVAPAFDREERQAYFANICALWRQTNSTMAVVPMVGAVDASHFDDGKIEEASVRVLDFLGEPRFPSNNTASCSMVGALRCDAHSFATFSGSINTPVFGVGLINVSGSAQTLGVGRVSIGVSRFERPDIGLALAVQ